MTGRDDAGEPVGELTGWTVVVREPEYLPSDYDSLLGLAAYEAGVGPCGYSHEHLMDPGRHFYAPASTPQCPACAAIAVQSRVMRDADEAASAKHGDKDTATLPLPSDGVRPYARMLTPDEAAAARNRTPAAAGAARPQRPATAKPKRLAGNTRGGE